MVVHLTGQAGFVGFPLPSRAAKGQERQVRLGEACLTWTGLTGFVGFVLFRHFPDESHGG